MEIIVDCPFKIGQTIYMPRVKTECKEYEYNDGMFNWTRNEYEYNPYVKEMVIEKITINLYDDILEIYVEDENWLRTYNINKFVIFDNYNDAINFATEKSNLNKSYHGEI